MCKDDCVYHDIDDVGYVNEHTSSTWVVHLGIPWSKLPFQWRHNRQGYWVQRLEFFIYTAQVVSTMYWIHQFMLTAIYLFHFKWKLDHNCWDDVHSEGTGYLEAIWRLVAWKEKFLTLQIGRKCNQLCQKSCFLLVGALCARGLRIVSA